MDGDFELLLEGMNDPSEATFHRVLSVLKDKCGISSHLVQELSHGTRSSLSLRKSSDSQELEVLSASIRAAGGKVLIVRQSNEATAAVVRDIRITSRHSDEASFQRFYEKYTRGLIRILHELDIEAVQDLAEAILATRERNGQIFIFGNGGSASTASHMANDLAKPRFHDERYLFRVISLTDNVAWMSANANDYGYHTVFTNQLRNLLQPGDLVIGISSSGNSLNINHAIDYANSKGATTYGIVGFGGGQLLQCAKRIINIPTQKGEYGFHEDVSLILNHIVTTYIAEKDTQQVERETC